MIFSIPLAIGEAFIFIDVFDLSNIREKKEIEDWKEQVKNLYNPYEKDWR